MGFSRHSLIFLAVCVVFVCASCQEETDPIDSGVDPPDMSCIDRDGDGYGVNCEDGLDCATYSTCAMEPAVRACSARSSRHASITGWITIPQANGL